MNEEDIDDTILVCSMLATIFGILLLAGGQMVSIGLLFLGVLGFAYLKTDGELLGQWLGASDDDSAQETEQDPLTTLRQRYASGEIDRAEFERRLNDLLETETLDQAETHHEQTPMRERSG